MNITPINAAHPTCSGVDCGRRAACSRYVGDQSQPADLASCVGPGLLFNARHARVSTSCLTACRFSEALGLDVVCKNPRLPLRDFGETVFYLRAFGSACGPRADLMEPRA